MAMLLASTIGSGQTVFRTTAGWRAMAMTDSDSRDAAFEAQLDALREHFLTGLPARRTALVAAWRDCTDGGDDAPWQRLREVAHKLAGSAPCYGLEAVGDVARELDRQLSGRQPCRERARVEAPVGRLLALMDAAISSA